MFNARIKQVGSITMNTRFILDILREHLDKHDYMVWPEDGISHIRIELPRVNWVSGDDVLTVKWETHEE